MHWDGTRVVAYDGRETAPMAADESLFLLPGGKAMPFHEAVVADARSARPAPCACSKWRTGGTASCLGEAVRAGASAGRRRLPHVAATEHAARIRKVPEVGRRRPAYFYLPDGKSLPVGTLVRNPAYARDPARDPGWRRGRLLHRRDCRDVVKAVRTHRNPGALAESDLPPTG